MKPRHAAALALVGWYLLLPRPLSTAGGEDYGKIIDFRHVPLSQWDRTFYNTKAECEVAEKGSHDLAERSKTWPKYPTVDDTPAYLRWSNAFCVRADDPRLKEK